MVGKKYFIALMTAALFLTSGLIAFAQMAPVRGTVTLKKADGSEAPVSNAAIEVYRTDSKGKLPTAKTDKKGAFSFAGFPLGQVFALVVSAPGIRTEVTPNIKAGMETVGITVYEGDGKPLTEDEVREALTVKPKAGGTNTGSEPTAADIEAAKKAKEEYDKQVADINAKNEKAKNTNEIVKKSLDEGRSAFDAKNYDLAIAKFDEGINADPDFEGSAPVLLNNKALALRLKGFDAYKASTADAANKATLMEKAKTDFIGSIDASNRTVEILKKATATDENLKKAYEINKYNALSNLVEVYRLMILTKADQTKTKEAAAAYQQYLTVETEATKKEKAQLQLGDIMREVGDSDGAIVAYKAVLETSPENPDALAGLGLSLFNAGAVASANGQTQEGKAQMQEGLNIMQKFADIAPATHPLKASVKEAVDYLKNTEKLTPQKITTPTTTKTTTKKKP